MSYVERLNAEREVESWSAKLSAYIRDNDGPLWGEDNEQELEWLKEQLRNAYDRAALLSHRQASSINSRPLFPPRRRNTMRRTFQVKVEKRNTGEIVEGTIQDDGLQSLWPVTTDDGETHYVSVLDKFISKIEVF